MATEPTNPLTDDLCQCVDTVLASTPDGIDLAERLIKCGIDCRKQLETLRAQKAMAEKVKSEFFPYKP